MEDCFRSRNIGACNDCGNEYISYPTHANRSSIATTEKRLSHSTNI